MSDFVLLIDGMNIFYRSYVVNPTLTPNGDPIGGTIGFLLTLQKNIKAIGPGKIKDIYICWDGPSGSRKRKSYNRDYKANRPAPRLNRAIHQLDEQNEGANRVHQQFRLVEYLDALGIKQMMFEYIEADDLISYMNSHDRIKNEKKIILSSDTDFYQLASDKTVVLEPYKHKLVTPPFLIREYGIAAHNFVLARSIAGDNSDNLKGVGGVGLKTIAQRLPCFAGPAILTIEDVLDECRKAQETSNVKAYGQVIMGEDTIRRNYKVMQLAVPIVSLSTKEKIELELERELIGFNKETFRKLLAEDGLLTYNFSPLSVMASKLAKHK